MLDVVHFVYYYPFKQDEFGFFKPEIPNDYKGLLLFIAPMLLPFIRGDFAPKYHCCMLPLLSSLYYYPCNSDDFIACSGRICLFYNRLSYFIAHLWLPCIRCEFVQCDSQPDLYWFQDSTPGAGSVDGSMLYTLSFSTLSVLQVRIRFYVNR